MDNLNPQPHAGPGKYLRAEFVDTSQLYTDWPAAFAAGAQYMQPAHGECDRHLSKHRFFGVTHNGHMNCPRCGNECKVTTEAHGPLPSHRYSIDLPGNISAEDATLLLAGLDLCLVRIDNGWAIALTRTCMDAGWLVAAGFVRLGLLPPCDLLLNPSMARRSLDADEAAVVQRAVVTSREVQETCLQQRAEDTSRDLGW